MRPLARKALSVGIAGALLAALVAGCVPADTPPQLQFTPGAPFTIADGVYRSVAFAVAYPAGWRVITPPAENPRSVIFAAPGDDALIFVTADPDQPPPPLPASPAVMLTETHATGVIVSLVTHAEREAMYEPVWRAVLASVRP